MFDTILRGAEIHDGRGSEPFTADVGLAGGKIAAIGRLDGARETLDVSGCILTPGFVDLHTHYDGEISWDEELRPSVLHGVTTVLMGNCGVGFAPVRPGRAQALLDLMEGVEDIPGTALAEGVPFCWESFPDYLDYLEKRPCTVDFAAQVPHDALRMYVMGDRARAPASAAEVAEMARLLREALAAGAAGFSTGRTDNHRSIRGEPTPAAESPVEELRALVGAMDRGVVQVVSDFDLLRGPEAFDAEFDLVDAVAAFGLPTSISWMERVPGAEQWRRIQARAEALAARGAKIRLQTATRGIGVMMGLGVSMHPFLAFPSFRPLVGRPPAEAAAAMRNPELRAKILGEPPVKLAGDSSVPPIVDLLLARIEEVAWRFYPLGDPPDYEPPVEASFGARARARGLRAMELLYDHLAEGDGENLVFFPIFNYAAGDLAHVGQMLRHPLALWGLSDAGAHVATICDYSNATTMLTHWARDRATDRIPLPTAVAMLSGRNAAHLGLQDRGVIEVGRRADLNLIDLASLALERPRVVHDLPAGGRRLLQGARGYVGSWVAGVRVSEEGELTGARPGRLLRF